MYATGCFYSGITVALGYKYMEQEGKTMGLAALGDSTPCHEQMSRITTSFTASRWRPYSHWIDYILTPQKDVFLETRSGRLLSNLASSYSHQNMAAAAQRLWEDNIVAFIDHQRVKHGIHDLVLAGGVFLNVKLIERICALEGIKSVFAHPHTGDGSTSIGAMIEGQRQMTGESCRLESADMGLGLEFSDQQIERALGEADHRITFHNISDPVKYAAKQLAAGKIIGWFQGREEYGPRSLGHRCILGDPRDPAVKQKITDRVKRRESFIPVAPSCLAEYGSTYFEGFTDRPFMTRTYRVKPEKRKIIPAALHVDGSARVQSVNREFYSPFRKLIEHFYIITGVPMVLNTSLNHHGDPIVHRPIEAARLLIESEMDELVIGPFAVRKSQFMNS
jgi:carbamoyltransferase